MKIIINIIALLLTTLTAFASTGHQISIEIANYEKDTLVLANYYGDKQYIKDTVAINEQGKFVFEGEEELDAGVYLVLLLPDNEYFQLLINKGAQHFSVKTDATALTEKMQINGSKDNELFYEYLGFLAQQRLKIEAIQKEIEGAKAIEKDQLNKKMTTVNKEVDTYRKNLVATHPDLLTAAFVNAYMEAPMPKFEGTEKEIQLKRYQHYKAHYFDNINLADERLVRSPFLFERIEYYRDKLTPKHPDSIIVTLDYLLEQVQPAPETFKYYLSHFLYEYATSKYVGMDAVYVHLVEKYYATGLATWTEEEQLTKLKENAATLKPLLIGKIAPDIKMFEIDVEGTINAKEDENKYQRWRAKRELTLHSIKSPYTVLFVWDPTCGNCKKAMPKMVAFHEAFKDRGVEVFAICTNTVQDDMAACAASIKEKNMIKWINAIDPFVKSNYKKLYDLTSTPQIYILDKDKRILSKKIGAEQLPEVMEQLMKSLSN